MSGYFIGPNTEVELGRQAFGAPRPRREVVTLSPPAAPARVHDAGGGILDIPLTGRRLRANLGDAERWAWKVLTALATSGPGELGIEDRRGECATWSDAVCVRASAEVSAFRFVTLECAFRAPESPSSPAWAGAPAAPATYSGTSTSQDYAAGGVDLGVGGTMRLEMERQAALRAVPRTRGARVSGPPSGAEVRLKIDAHAKADAAHLAAYLHDMARSIGARPVDLSANGNSYAGVVLDDLRPDHSDTRAASFTAEFVRSP